MERQILLGVDGGNTKTDYFLFTADGKELGHLRMGSINHEGLPGAFADTKVLMQEHLTALCAQSGIRLSDITYAVMGLAGADTKYQHEKLQEAAEQILPGRVFVCNDSMLGVMAAAPNGIGVCCINGTWATVCGIDDEGTLLQVGGIGNVSSDFAGGGHVANEALRLVYSAKYRDGEKTALTEEVLKLLHAPENADLMELFHYNNLDIEKYRYDLDVSVFRCARQGDRVAQEILHQVAHTLAMSTAGCIKNLHFKMPVTIVLAGSLWVKGDYPELLHRYQKETEQRVGLSCNFVILQEPPALGAVLEAYRRVSSEPLTEARRKAFASAMQ